MTSIRLTKAKSYGIYDYQGLSVYYKKDNIYYSALLQNNSVGAFSPFQVGDSFVILFDGTRIVRFGTKFTLN